MIRLILIPPHASMALSAPNGSVIERRPDGSFDVTSHPALISQHPDWQFERIDEAEEAPEAMKPAARVLLRPPSPAISQIFASDGTHITIDANGFFDVSRFPELARQYASWVVTETAD